MFSIILKCLDEHPCKRNRPYRKLCNGSKLSGSSFPAYFIIYACAHTLVYCACMLCLYVALADTPPATDEARPDRGQTPPPRRQTEPCFMERNRTDAIPLETYVPMLRHACAYAPCALLVLASAPAPVPSVCLHTAFCASYLRLRGLLVPRLRCFAPLQAYK